jgi:hypothetical protein
MPKSNEYMECVAYWKWSQTNPVLRKYLIKHVNEGKRTKLTGHYLNRIGMRKGLPDYQLPLGNGNWIGFWLEMKPRNQKNFKKKPEQVEWIEKLRLVGHYANFSYGWEDAMHQTLDYINNKI